MIAEELQRLIDEMSTLPVAEQKRLAKVLESLLHEPILSSDVVRPEVRRAFEQALAHSPAVLDYLRDK